MFALRSPVVDGPSAVDETLLVDPALTVLPPSVRDALDHPDEAARALTLLEPGPSAVSALRSLFAPRLSDAGLVDALVAAERQIASLQAKQQEFLTDRRTDRWAIADRVVWGEQGADQFSGDDVIAALLAARKPIEASAQLIHGDLTGNVLFAEGLAPLVIDFSPYWPPAAFAAATVVVDALVFEGADASLVEQVASIADIDQYLVRALIFRAVTDRISRLRRPDVEDPYAPVAELVLRQCAAR
jgi:hypothetical protein